MNNKLRITFAVCLLNVILISPLLAQIPTAPVSLPSPNAAGLGLYGEYPVSYFTGVPDISIPLYTLKEREISVPISLSYHASGFRPEVHPGWVGQGWSLNAGGVITRVVNGGVADEQNVKNSSSVPDPYNCSAAGFFYNTAYLGIPGWSSTNNLFTIANLSCGYSTVNEPPIPTDTAPDEFSFSFPGCSGKFYLQTDPTGQNPPAWKVMCDKPVTVTAFSVVASSLINVPMQPPPNSFLSNDWGYSQTISGFTIKAEDGTQYVFGENPNDPTHPTDAIEYSTDYFNQNNAQWTANSWYLTEIVSKNNNETVTFTYTPDSYINQIYLNLNCNFNTTSTSGSFQNCGSSSFSNLIYGGQLIRPVYLTAISTSNYTVTFGRCTTNELSVSKDVYDVIAEHGGVPNSNGSSYLPRFPFINNGNFSQQGSCSINQQVAKNNSIHPLYTENGTDKYETYWNNLFWQQLTNISIYNGPVSGQPIKQFNFGYSSDPTVRLTLYSLTEVGLNGVSKPPYNFSYWQSAQPLPGYLAGTNSYQQNPDGSITVTVGEMGQEDHWGFWNGASPSIKLTYLSNPNSISFNVDTTGYYAMRQPQSNFAEATMLREIQYPTGGRTDFFYQPNDYGKALKINRTTLTTYTSNIEGGGVRIGSIINYPTANNTPSFEKDYYYVNNYTNGYQSNPSQYISSGFLGGQAQYSYNYTIEDRYWYNNQIQNGGVTYTANLFSTNSVLPVSNNSMGSPIGYSEVVERRSDGSYTKYKYTNFDTETGHFDVPPVTTLSQTPTFYQPYTSLENERGKISVETQYNAADLPAKTTSYTYTALDQAHSLINAVKARSFNVCPVAQGSIGYAAEGSAYGFYTYSYLPSTVITQVFDQNGSNPVTTTQNYYYDNPVHKQVTRSELINSKSETLSTVNIYPQDYNYASANDFTTQMVAINNVGTPIETVTLRSGPNKPYEVISGKITEYPTATGDYPSAIYTLDLAQPIPLSSFQLSNQAPGVTYPFRVPGNAYAHDTQYYREEAKMDYNYEKLKDFYVFSNQTTANLTTSLLWDVSRRQPVAEVKNATFNMIAYAGFEENEPLNGSRTTNPNGWNIPQNITTSTYSFTGHNCANIENQTLTTVSNMPVATFILSYWSMNGPIPSSNFGNVSAVTTTTGAMTRGWTYYEHKITVATAAPVSITGISTGNQYIDDLRLYPQFALMTTYTYDPLVGMTSMTDARGMPTYYQYDNLQRLMNIMDYNQNITKHYDYNYAGQIGQ